jgi:two-component system sensor kinase FixL
LDAKTGSMAFDRMAYLNAILETLPEAVAIIGLDHRLVDLNPAGLAMVGAKSIEDVPGQSPLALLSPESVPAFHERFQAVVSGGDDHSPPVLIDVKSLDGTCRAVECRMARLRNLDGEIAGIVLTARDVSWRKENQQAVADGDALLHAILDTVPDAMVVIDELGLITSFSLAAEKLFGYREVDVLGQNVSMLMPSPHKEAHDGYLQRYLQTGEKRIIGIGRTVIIEHLRVSFAI